MTGSFSQPNGRTVGATSRWKRVFARDGSLEESRKTFITDLMSALGLEGAVVDCAPIDNAFAGIRLRRH